MIPCYGGFSFSEPFESVTKRHKRGDAGLSCSLPVNQCGIAIISGPVRDQQHLPLHKSISQKAARQFLRSAGNAAKLPRPRCSGVTEKLHIPGDLKFGKMFSTEQNLFLIIETYRVSFESN